MKKLLSDVDNERKRTLVREMYEILASSSAEIERLEQIIGILIPVSDKEETTQLILMSVDARKYRVKFSRMVGSIFDKEFNIVELCRKLHTTKTDT